MSRRTCANRSGSLARWLAVDSNFLPHDLDSTAPYLNPVLTVIFCLLSFIFFILLYLTFPNNSCTHLKPSSHPTLSSSCPSLPPPIPTTKSLECLQKVAHHQGWCAAPFPSRGPLARSSSLPAENVQITGSCRKAVGSPQTLRSKLLPRERPGKKPACVVRLRAS